MLDGIGALLCLSFVATCLGTTPGLPRPPPPTTAAYLLAFSLVSLLATLGLLPADLLPLQPHGAHRSWQYASAFLCADGAAAAALQLWLFAVHSSALEAAHFAAAPLAYARFLAAGAALLAAGGAAAAGGEPLSLAHALCFYVVGLAARVEPTKLTRVLGVTLQWAFVPWLLLLCLLPLTGVRAAIFNTLGLAAALAVHTAVGLPPPRPKAFEAEAEAATPKRKAFGAWQGKSSKPPLKSSPLLGERWLHTAQAGLAVLLLLWQSGTRASDRRAHASVEMAFCRALRQAMDPHAPMLAQLLDKFAKTHPDHPTADAHTIFAAWSFAAEHWAQAQAQAKSGIDLNKLPPAEAEVLRGLVAQGLARSELPDEMSDKELVPEALNLMGFSRLVVKPEVLPFLEQAVGEYRRHRARTSAAWSFLKSFLSHPPSPLPHAEVHLAVNASLAEYDLPSRMTDEAVLSELFALLDWPRAALSYCADQLLLAAVRSHRAERAAAARDALRSLSHAARALALDESAAPPAAASRNESLHRALLDAFNWMELRADASAEEAWAAAAAALNLSAADEPRLLAVEGTPLLRTVVEQIRARRAAEARVQQAFEELVATVRTEDPALAAEEAKKQRMAEAYEAKRIEWLSALLGRAQQRGLAIPPPRNASDGAAAAAVAAAAEGDASEVEACDEAPTAARVEEWVEELAALRGKRAAAAAETKEEGHERQKHAHYARLLKLPRLIDETLASWIDPSDDLSDKQASEV
ncbi:hypothetical protein AB1Y20_012393 [Prymnesium parvum]|uniref:Derlin n=1 Tax=Prymnesium parvum TaxID=97485 RepID=A0AB34IPE7_PRYPA